MPHDPFHQIKNNASGILISDNTNTLSIYSGDTLPNDVSSGNFYVTIGEPKEIIEVIGVSIDATTGVKTLEVLRGVEDTSSYLHSTSDSVQLFIITKHLEEIKTAIDLLYTTFSLDSSSIPILPTGTVVQNGLDVTGNITITGTVDGVNLSSHAAAADAHHSRYTDAEAVSALSGHTSNTNNPHSVTKAQVGLSNVTNVDHAAALAAHAGTAAIHIDWTSASNNFNTTGTGKFGGTVDVTGTLTVGPTVGNGNITIKSPNGNSSSLIYNTDSTARWSLLKTTDSETGSDVGSNLTLNAYSDTGTPLGAVFTITRAVSGSFDIFRSTKFTTNVDITGILACRSSATIASTLDVTGGVTFRNTATIASTLDVTGVTSLKSSATIASTLDCTGKITGRAGASIVSVLDVTSTGESEITINNGGSGYLSLLSLRTGALKRWTFEKTDTAESGSNVGSDLNINACNDDGSFLDTPFSITRVSTGSVIIRRNATFRYNIDCTGTFTCRTNATINSTSPLLIFNESDQTGANGVFRLHGTGGQLYLQQNTAAARDFSTSTNNVIFNSGGQVQFINAVKVGTTLDVTGNIRGLSSVYVSNVLDVTGQLYVRSTSTSYINTHSFTSSILQLNSFGTGNRNSSIEFYSNDTSSDEYMSKIIRTYIDNNLTIENKAGDIVFRTSSGVYSSIENVMTLYSTGNVHIDNDLEILGTLTVGADLDKTIILGKARMGYLATQTDEFRMSHYDNFNSISTHAIAITASETKINSPTTIRLTSADSTMVSLIYTSVDTSSFSEDFTRITLHNLPTSSAGLNVGEVYRDVNGFLKVKI